MSAVTVPEIDAVALCAIAKTASPSESWSQGEKLGTYKMAFGVVCAPPRRGLVIEIYINQGYKVQRQTLNFGLWDREPGVLTRIYQLTIADALTPSHKEKGVQWYGSHQHMGSTVTQLQHLNSDNFFQSLELFCRTISLTLDEPISNPFDFKLS